MRLVIQRVSQAQVVVRKLSLSQINQGLLVFLGIARHDSDKDVDYLVKKIINLRIFPDQQNKMNLSVKDVKGEFLVVSQFTLLADSKKGHRPSFIQAAPPAQAQRLYQLFIDKLTKTGLKVVSGEFGAFMQVKLVNTGPVTIIIDSPG